MKVYVLIAKAVTDVAGEMLAGEEIVGVFSTFEKATVALDKIEGTYYRKTYDYDICEEDVK